MKRIRKYTYLILLAGIFLGITSCEDITEEDISEKDVRLIAPSDDLITDQSTITFWWDSIPEVAEYNLVVVSESFDYIEKLVLDTILLKSHFQHQFRVSGRYEWYVKALNYWSNASSDTFSLVVSDSAGVTNLKPVLINPKKTYINNGKVFFSWKELEFANSYLIQIRKNKWEDGELIYVKTVQADTHTVFLEPGNYAYGLLAEADNGVSDYTKGPLVIDTTKPPAPTLLSPDNEQMFNKESVDFEWNTAEDNLSPIASYEIKIATDQEMTDVIHSKTVNDTSASFNFNESGEYYWHVAAKDKAGNNGETGTKRIFTLVNP